MARHALPTVVRLWTNGYSERPINALVHDWDGGRFSLPADHPLAQALWNGSLSDGQSCIPLGNTGNMVLTVLDTEELEWTLSQISTYTDENHCRRYAIRFTPRHQRLRNALAFDWQIVEAGRVS